VPGTRGEVPCAPFHLLDPRYDTGRVHYVAISSRGVPAYKEKNLTVDGPSSQDPVHQRELRIRLIEDNVPDAHVGR